MFSLAMNDLGDNLHATSKEIIATIKRLLLSQQGPLVVALDGGSGAGKSILAAVIAEEIEVALIPLDDFFAADIPDAQWDRFTTEEKLKHVFDWDRLRGDVIEPLMAGQMARWHAFDFEAGMRADGTYRMQGGFVERAPADVILLEGAYAAGPYLADLVDLSILVDVPVEKRHTRLQARETVDFLEQWHQRWDAVEDYYFNHVRPLASFDFVVRPG
jgi:uridine kinase